ncbi:MAG: EamA family transporter, partial [Xanthomonadales bacterium]|nr:EamA family transporter [Xanthomonadales bacterium]
GYFINPLVNVLLGFLLLRERLTAVQTAAVLLAAAGTAYLGWFLGTPPWIALTLAFSFGLFGQLRKQHNAGPMVGLMWECLILVLPALAYLAWLGAQGTRSFGTVGPGTDWLLVFAGLVTVLPLTWFAMAARRLKLSVVGFFQYLAPTLTFLLAVFLYGEPFTPGHAVAFTCIWAGLALISWETLRAMRGVRHG